MIKLIEISRRVGGPIKSGRESKTMVDRDIKERGRVEPSKFLWLDVSGASQTGSPSSPAFSLFRHDERYPYM